MVQQLSLFDSIDDASYDLFISTITTLSGNSPVLFANISTIWKPDESYDIERVNLKNQLAELNKIKLCKELPLSLFNKTGDSSTLSYTLLKTLAQDSIPIEPSLIDSLLHNIEIDRHTPSDINDDSKMDVDVESHSKIVNDSWTLSMSDIPAAGSNRKVSMQSISESVILSTAGKSASISKFLKELCYTSVYQYVTVGVKFYMKHDLIMEIQKIWDISNSGNIQVTKGGALIKAYVNVNRVTDIERINQAENTLLSLQKELQGYVDLAIPDRKAMDSRLDYISDIV